jgi:hypothetical protein
MKSAHFFLNAGYTRTVHEKIDDTFKVIKYNFTYDSTEDQIQYSRYI